MTDTFFNGGSIMFSIIPIIVFIGFFLVFGVIIVALVQSARTWKRNNDSPVLTVDAVIVAKRMNVSHYNHNNGVDTMDTMSSSTDYFVTFEVASGDRMELMTHGSEFGLLAEQDAGKLTFQGTRYLGFERDR